MFEALYSVIPDLSTILHEASTLLWFLFIAGFIALIIPYRIFTFTSSQISNLVRKRWIYIPRICIFFLLLQAVAIFSINQIDNETRVEAPKEKILIIEIDDFWNLEKGYFSRYGYSIENYESMIELIDAHGFQATLGVSPYIFIEENQEIYSLRDDEAMVEYLKEKKEKGHEIAMHGYSHCRNVNFCPEYEENYLNILQGKKELDQLFNQTTFTYLPPGNSWSDEQYKNVKKTGFLIIPNTEVSKIYWDEHVLITHKGFDVVDEWNWYKNEYKHSNYTEWVKKMEQTDIFIIQLHSNTFDSKAKLQDLDRFLDVVEEKGIQVVTYQDAYIVIRN